MEYILITYGSGQVFTDSFKTMKNLKGYVKNIGGFRELGEYDIYKTENGKAWKLRNNTSQYHKYTNYWQKTDFIEFDNNVKHYRVNLSSKI